MGSELNTREIVVVEGESSEAFTVPEMGNPKWWICPACGRTDVNSIYRNMYLRGFKCVAVRDKDHPEPCRFVWHYKAVEV